MDVLTTEGMARLGLIARQNDVSDAAVHTVLRALARGGGTQAQFSHPDLGGLGQWARGGMIMIGDMFNSALKAKVDRLCTEVSDLMREPGLFETSPDTSGSTAPTTWWPDALGQPSSSGSQDGTRYAYFPDERRLAIDDSGEVRVYDTGNHRISGVSQRQGNGRDLAFQSQNGTVRAHDLPLIEAAPAETVRASLAAREIGKNGPDAAAGDVFQTIEKLHDLMRKGILSEADFSTKKKELLARI